MTVPSENPVADLILELDDPRIHDDAGVHRAAARAKLVYEPPPGSRDRKLTGPRFDLVAPLGPIEKHEIDWIQRGNRPHEADSLHQLGNVYSLMGRREEAVRFYRQAVEIYVEIEDLAKEGVLRNNVANQLIQLRRYDEARQEILRAIECKEAFGHAALPWTSFDILHNLERAVGDDAAAVRARGRAVQAFLGYRRAGGENHSGAGRLAIAVGQAIVAGKTEDLAGQLTEMRSSVAPEDLLFLAALQDVLAGSRDPALASDPGMHYSVAVELTLLLEALASVEGSAASSVL